MSTISTFTVSARECRDLRRSHGGQSREIIDSKNVSKMVDEKEANEGYLKRYLFIISVGIT